MKFQVRRAEEPIVPDVHFDGEKFENGPWVNFTNFTKDSKSLVCTVFAEENDDGILIYIPSVCVEAVFTKLGYGD